MEERRPLLIRHQSNGRIPARSRLQTQMACGLILLTEILERIAFYGIVANLVLFLSEDPMNWSSYNAAQASMVFTGLAYTSSLFGGWLADSVLGRFKTICLFFVIYIVGYVLMPVLALPHRVPSDPMKAPSWCAAHNSSNPSQWMDLNHAPKGVNDEERHRWIEEYMKISSAAPSSGSEICAWGIYLSLTIMGIGTGAVKANVAPFGADQVKHEGPYMMRVFFNWFYWCINLGAFLAIAGLAFVQQVNFFWGLVIPNICLVLALVVFATGFAVYIMKPPGGSVLTNIVKIMIESCQVRRRRRIASTISRSMDLSDVHRTPNCLDHAKVRYGGSFHDAMVDDVKILGKIICVFLALIPYWVVYFQMESTYVVQGLHMRLDFSSSDVPKDKKFIIPAAWLSLFDVVFLIVLIPVMDRVIYPRLDRAGYHLNLRLRIIIGMVFSILSVSIAGGLEMYRLNKYWQNNTEHAYPQNVGGTNYSAADVPVLWQIPQYGFIGVSEVFASVAGLELAYTYAPRSMQGIIMGLFWFTQGIGSLVGTATVSWSQGSFFFKGSNDINCRIPCDPDHKEIICHACHLDYYFFTLAGLQVVGLVVFIAIAIKFDIGSGKAPLKHRIEISNSTSTESPPPSPQVIQPKPVSPPRERHVQHKRSPVVTASTSTDAERS